MSDVAPSGRSLPPVVRQLGAVSFFNDLASEMVYPLLPALITTRLGGTAVALGALDGIADAVAATVKAAAGRLADRPGWRRPLVVGGYLLAALARPAMGVAAAAWHVIGLRGADRFGKGIRTPPRDTVIADETPADLRGRAFGFHRAMDHAGAVVGPLLAWALLAAAGATPVQVIVWSLIPGAAAVVIVGWAMGRVGDSAPERQGLERGEPASAPSRTSTKLLVGLIVGFAFVRFPEALFLLRVQDLGVAVATVPLLWAAMHVVRTASAYPGGWLSDRVGPRLTMLGGWGVYAGVCFGLAAATTGTMAIFWLLVLGLVAAGTESPERAFIASATRAGRRGRGFGRYHAAVGLAALPGGLLFGWLYQAQGSAVALVTSGLATIPLLVVGASVGRR